jgi:hypothetical protein
MGWLGKIFGRGGATITRTTEQVAADCPHVTLSARWDNVQDMGQEDKATSYICATCSQRFTPEEAAAHRESQTRAIRSITDTEHS